MNGDDLHKFVPGLLEARYPGCSTEIANEGPGHFGWVLEIDNSVALIRANPTNSHPFIWIRGGIAHEIPRTEALATYIAAGNKDLMVGRIYMAYGDDVAMAVFDEAIVGAYLSLDYQPSVEDVVNRLENGLQYASQWAKETLERFGGRPFTTDDWHLMSF